MDGTVWDFNTLLAQAITFSNGMTVGTPCADTLDGTAGSDVIVALNGDDTLNGLAGDDTLAGWAGNDVLNGGDGDDTLKGDGFSDTDVDPQNQGNDALDGVPAAIRLSVVVVPILSQAAMATTFSMATRSLILYRHCTRAMMCSTGEQETTFLSGRRERHIDRRRRE
jgi:Ca2+-binding RTX toxin-like protein